MNEQTHVILTIKSYEDVLNFMSTQPYGNVAQLISELVNDANDNKQKFSIMPIIPPKPTPVAAAPEAKAKKMEIVKESEGDTQEVIAEEVTDAKE